MNRRLAIVATTAVLSVLPGCVGGDGKLSHSFYSPFAQHASAPAPAVIEVVGLWENRIVTTEDTVNQGARLNGLAGRVHLFGQGSGTPMAAKGTLTVTAHEVLPDNKTVPLEAWEIDATVLPRLATTDRIGLGYNLFLPLRDNRPDVKRISLQVKFVPEKGTPIYSPHDTISLSDDGRPVITTGIVPASGFHKK